jgi:hypothetical protein
MDTTKNERTPEEIELLKSNWLKDPCWDIEETEGFEAHRDELAAFHEEKKAEWERKIKESSKRRISKVIEETGISDPIVAMYLHTFVDIEQNLNSVPDHTIGEHCSIYEDASLDIQRAHARATLLLAAQVKRVAELLARK